MTAFYFMQLQQSVTDWSKKSYTDGMFVINTNYIAVQVNFTIFFNFEIMKLFVNYRCY